MPPSDLSHPLRLKKNVSPHHPAGQYDELQVLYTISDTISTNLDLDSVFAKIIEMVGFITGADSCLLYLKMDDVLVLRASQNPHPEMIGKLRIPLGRGITGWVAQHREPVIIEREARYDPRFMKFRQLPEDLYQAFLSVPIFFRNKVIGVINVQHRESRQYQEHIVHLLSVIGRQVGGAIENARMLEETQTLQSVLETRKLVDTAKTVLSRKLAITPEQAYEMLLAQTQHSGKAMREVCEAVVMTEEIEK